MTRPSGTVTFLFTDIEGSTRRWEIDPDAMGVALAAHDEVLRSAIESHGGWLFKHTGDGAAAAFSSARAAIDAAIDAQRTLALPVRMGIATGEAQERSGDYFGPVLNRAARVMAAGHGGQVLVAASTALVASGADLIDLGEHALRDLSGVERLYQVRADGLRLRFPALRTIDAIPGNLPVQVTSFVGRDVELKELAELVRAHRLITLTGVGGVGKTRLAVHVAGEMVTEFPDGVWLVELAPVGDPAAVADAVATVLAIGPQAGLTVSDSIAQALSGRKMLIILDNCEHVLDSAAAVVEAILERTQTVTILATSREGLRTNAEHLWPVPSLDVEDGLVSPAAQLFIERARAVAPGFDIGEPSEAAAVSEICTRLDGIALAIELAAARMVSLTASGVRDRLGDRFRLLSGSRRGLERHQTLRHAIAWSYGLLDPDERAVLNRCSVFADGFDLDAVRAVAGDGLDEYTVLDLLDSLVRKSLVVANRSGGTIRYALLETIRQFAEDQLVDEGAITETRTRHASYFAAQVFARWQLWDGPRQREAVQWTEVEFANLRAAFWWATDNDIETAATVAAHAMLLSYILQRFEPIGWAEEILAASEAIDLVYLPRLHTAASFCQYTGRIEDALAHFEAAVALQDDPRYVPFGLEWTRVFQANAERFAGRIDRFHQICLDMVHTPGPPRAWASALLLYAMPTFGSAETERARAMADETIETVRRHGNPFFTAFATIGYARAFAAVDPHRAHATLRQALAITKEHHLPYLEALVLREAGRLEAVFGEPKQALEWFDVALDSFHRGGNVASLTLTLAYLAAFFERTGQPEIAATVLGNVSTATRKNMGVDLAALAERLSGDLAGAVFDQCLTTGAALDLAEVVHYARAQIEHARHNAGAAPIA